MPTVANIAKHLDGFAPPELTADAEAVTIGQHDVEDHASRRRLTHDVERVGP